MFQSLPFIISSLYSARKQSFELLYTHGEVSLSQSFNVHVLISFIYEDVILKGSYLNSSDGLDLTTCCISQSRGAQPLPSPGLIPYNLQDVCSWGGRGCTMCWLLDLWQCPGLSQPCMLTDCLCHRYGREGQGAALLCILQLQTMWSIEVMNQPNSLSKC